MSVSLQREFSSIHVPTWIMAEILTGRRARHQPCGPPDRHDPTQSPGKDSAYPFVCIADPIHAATISIVFSMIQGAVLWYHCLEMALFFSLFLVEVLAADGKVYRKRGAGV
jgi:hypothetical protein